MDPQFVEAVAAGAVNAQMPEAIALVINLLADEAPLQALAALHPQQAYKVYYVNDPLGTALPLLRAQCADLGLPCLILDNAPQAEAARYPVGPADRTAWITASDTLWPQAFDPESPPCAYAAWLGYQTYLCQAGHLHGFADTYFEALRLGVLRQKPDWAEPLLREAHRVFVSMDSLRLSDYPHPGNLQPNGLYAEEFCQLCRYTGLAPHLQECLFYGLPQGLPAAHPANRLLAQGLWHLLEGLAVRVRELPGHEVYGAGLERKVVPLGAYGTNLVFYHSPRTGRWWMEISAEAGCIACSATDYQLARRGEVPLKWLHYYPASFLE